MEILKCEFFINKNENNGHVSNTDLNGNTPTSFILKNSKKMTFQNRFHHFPYVL